MNSLKSMMIVLFLIPVAGCSFHSAQWESAKALWSMRAPVTHPENETYWWNMEHEGETYRLFPVAWDGKTVLTNASRWLIVLQNSEVTMIRDFQKNQQISFESAADSVVGEGETGGDSGSSKRYLDPSFTDAWTEISIVVNTIDKPLEIARTTMFCYPSRLDSQSLRLVTRCTSGEQQTDFQMAGLDQSGNILMVRVNTPSSESWAIYRSDDLVNAFEVKRYLNGDVDEI